MKKIIVLLGFCLLSISCVSTEVVAVEHSIESINALIAEGGKLEAKDTEGMTALMWAARYKHTEAVNALIATGADVNAKNNESGTALMYVAEEGHVEAVKALLEAGAVIIEELSIHNNNFKTNNPYGFEKNIFYKPESQGKTLQWLSISECLYDFAGATSSQLSWSCLAFVELGEYHANVLSNSYNSLFFEYIGVYSYTAASGSYNTIPKFKVRIIE